MLKSLWVKLNRRITVLRQFRRPAAAWLFLRLFSFAVIAPWLMYLRAPKLTRLLTPRHSPGAADPVQVQQILVGMDAVMRVGRPLVQVRCLTRGLTLYYFLRRAGLVVELWFGVSKTAERFGAHCWLVKDGEPFGEKADPRAIFTPVYHLPAE